DDRALHWTFERAVDVLDGGCDGACELRGIDSVAALHRIGEAEQEVGQDHSAVAARTENRRLGCLAAHVIEPRVLDSPEVVSDGGRRQGEVRSGVAIRNGKDIDAIELCAALLNE